MPTRKSEPPKPGRLPDWEELYKLAVVHKLTYSVIADRYGVHSPANVCHKLRRGAQQRGLAWPLEGVRKPGGTREGMVKSKRWDLVDARMVKAEIKYFLETHPDMYRYHIAQGTGIARTTIYDLCNHYTHVSRDIVERIMAFIESHEREEAA